MQELPDGRGRAKAEGVPIVALLCAWTRCTEALYMLATFCKLTIGLLWPAGATRSRGKQLRLRGGAIELEERGGPGRAHL